MNAGQISPPRIAIRAAAAGESDSALAIWRAAVDATHHFVSAADRAAIDDDVRALLPAAPILFAVDDMDRPIGFMITSESRLEGLFVDPRHHGRGVGRALVLHALAPHPAITVEVNTQNEQAIGFYVHLGFVEIGRTSVDSQGRAYPLIQMRLDASSRPGIGEAATRSSAKR
jgi:putative acetyltransferase